MATGTPAPTLSETGMLPTGVTFTTTTGVLSGTPAAGTGGTYPITFKATSSSGTTSQSFTLTVDQAPAITSANSTTFTVGTNGSFTVTTTGFPQDPITETGALPTGVTFVDNGNNTATLSGTPAAGTAGSYPIMITASNSVLPNATQAFTLTVAVAGACTSGGSESLLSGGYAFLLKGLDSSGNPALVGGVITLDGAGHVTAGTMDMNLNSGVQTAINVSSGTFSVGSDHRGCMSLTTNSVTNATQTFRFSLGNISGTPAVASTGHMINFDSGGPFTTGIMRKQSGGPFSNASVNGSFAFGASSIQNAAVGGGKLGVVGVANFDGGGTITGGSEDFNQSGRLDGSAANTTWPASPVPITGGTYSVSANGHSTFTLTVSGITFHSVFFVVSSSEALFMVSDPQTSAIINAGQAFKQSGGPFSLSSLNGSYVGYDTALGTSGGTTAAEIFLVNPAGNGNLTITIQQNKSGTISTQSGPGTYNITDPTSGRVFVTLGGKHDTLLYLVSASKAFLLNDNGRVNFGFAELQSGSPFSSTSASGTYAFGSVDPEDPSVSEESGVATFASPNVSGTSDDNSNGSTPSSNPFGPQSYSIDSTGLGVTPSGCTIGGAGSAGCQLAFYIISPTKAALIQLQSSNGTNRTNPEISVADK
jgi:large repetitive protein